MGYFLLAWKHVALWRVTFHALMNLSLILKRKFVVKGLFMVHGCSYLDILFEPRIYVLNFLEIGYWRELIETLAWAMRPNHTFGQFDSMER
ncbi:hypothetical protein H5410_052513 [Solanum commersonii]|uniref:Uncharacterized protein n=1 Tax=Solanum commersonii TaxID=4109 RepID=A0A9J5X3U2_SOLCO|nr:hypothetical protein H5410_052513 [Solanum commersonii]